MLEKDQKKQFIERALADTFEGIAFSEVLAQSELDQPAQVADDAIGVALDFNEPLDLELFFLVTADHAREAFEAVSGLDGSEVDQQVLKDFVKELTNTVGGHLAFMLDPEKKDMMIGLPKLVEGEERRLNLTPGEDNLLMDFQVENHHVLCGLRVRP